MTVGCGLRVSKNTSCFRLVYIFCLYRYLLDWVNKIFGCVLLRTKLTCSSGEVELFFVRMKCEIACCLNYTLKFRRRRRRQKCRHVCELLYYYIVYNCFEDVHRTLSLLTSPTPKYVPHYGHLPSPTLFPALFDHMTTISQWGWRISFASSETHEASQPHLFFFNCCSCCITGHHNTLERKRRLPSFAYLSIQMLTIGQYHCDWQDRESNSILPTHNVLFLWAPGL